MIAPIVLGPHLPSTFRPAFSATRGALGGKAVHPFAFVDAALAQQSPTSRPGFEALVKPRHASALAAARRPKLAAAMI